MLIDSHVHLWNPEMFRYEWLDGIPKLNRRYWPGDLDEAAKDLGVGKRVFVECGRAGEQAWAEARWISTLAQGDARWCGIVAHAAVERGDAVEADLAALAGLPLVRGVRRLLQQEGEADCCLRPEFVAGVRRLAGHGFTFDVCIRADQLGAVTELVRRVPEVTFVLDHFGKPAVKVGGLEPWGRELRALAALPNVVVKISGLTTEAEWGNWTVEQLRPYFDVTLESFGYARALFGSDWPVCTLATSYRRWAEVVDELTSAATPGERQQLFQANAERVYRL